MNVSLVDSDGSLLIGVCMLENIMVPTFALGSLTVSGGLLFFY